MDTVLQQLGLGLEREKEEQRGYTILLLPNSIASSGVTKFFFLL